MVGIETAVGLLATLSDVLALLDRFLQEGNLLARLVRSLSNKIDEKDLRRFRSSCHALLVALDSNSSKETRLSHMKHAEDGFLEYIQLDPKRDFGPLPGRRVLAIANAGLAQIYETRGDKPLIRTHKLWAFYYEPAEARETLFPDFYIEELKREVDDNIEEWYRFERQKIEHKDYELEAQQRKYPVYKTVRTSPRPYGPPYTDIFSETQVVDHWESRASEELKREDIEALEQQKQNKLDEACRSIAYRSLTGRGASPNPHGV